MLLTLRQLAETAAFASARSPALIESSVPVSESRLQDYWRFSRGRTLEWIRRLDELRQRAAHAEPDDHPQIWREAAPLCREVFVTEMLTRVWAAVLQACDARHRDRRAGPIGRHTFETHRQVRIRVLELMLHELRLSTDLLSGVDRTRRRSERWTDLLLGHLAVQHDLQDLPFEAERAAEFGRSWMHELVRASDVSVWEFTLAGIRLAFSRESDDVTLTDVWNRGIVQSVLNTVPAECFDEAGLFKSLRRLRIERGGAEQDVFPSGPSAPQAHRGRLRFSVLKPRRNHPEH